ncbi:PD-(D/E)XK nuclease-like domain-containing protein [Enterocloster citroniae]|uniref:PD-(D/E)XK nuclease-like domain-containing protein n=1 Tax=Enterocloster citroniae TaxID=358743 RepID=UPI0022E3032B|nr:PD-(D/E)XK nuclease-like domain-containing protein [Enterocloster citroniae]
MNKGFILSQENYYLPETNQLFCSASQYKQAIGCIGHPGCEATMLAQLRGDWEFETSIDMLIGSYVDARYEGTIEQFQEEHQELFVSRGERKGQLKAEFIKAEQIYRRCEKDTLFSAYMSGEKQVIMTGEIAGVPFKIKMDSLHRGKCIVDLKVMQDLSKQFWVRDYGHMDFITYWGYDIQLAIYQEIYYQNTGERLPTYICAADKGKVTDIAVIYVDDMRLRECLEAVKANAPKIQMLKLGEIDPIRCELCDYCKSTKVLNKPIHFSELTGDV